VSRVKVTVLSDASAPSLVLAVLPPFAAAAGVPAEDERKLGSVVEGLLAFTLEHAYPGDELGEIEVTLEAGDDHVQVAVHDWGRPLMSRGGGFGPLPEALAAIGAEADGVQLLNLGAGGKRLTAEVPVRSIVAGQAAPHHVDAASRAGPASPGGEDAIELRAGTALDAEAIAQLLYENYHLSYVHEDFYRPRYLMAVLEMRQLLSTVAVHEGRVIGHHGLMPLAGGACAETGAAVVHSAYRGLGIFGRMVDHTLAVARERGLASVFGDAVTIHPFSQRAELSHGYREAALQLAMVPAQTTMRAVGGGGPGRRTATLRSYLAFDPQPRRIASPAPYRDLLDDIYANLGLAAERRAETAPSDGELVTTEADEPRALGFLRLRRWDADGPAALRRALRHLLSLHVDVVYADVDLMAVDGDDATAELNDLGFFAAGLILHGPDGHDHLRLQLLDSEEVELENIVCDSPFADELRRRVLEDKARVGA
jgi:N-acetylglutamate synthase-like GNAT family acetyltransferase/anti-sigma regulatory factor (Ser/Thr protein kinase)